MQKTILDLWPTIWTTAFVDLQFHYTSDLHFHTFYSEHKQTAALLPTYLKTEIITTYLILSQVSTNLDIKDNTVSLPQKFILPNH